MNDPSSPDSQDDAPLQALLWRLDALGRMALPDAAAVLVTEASALARTLGPADRPQIDQTTFDTLLALAGPLVAPELLHQLADDLAGVAAALPLALSVQDRASLRAQTHVLMALAGSVGAGPLYDAATRLNTVAHGAAPVADDGDAVLAGLARLRVYIDAARGQAPHASP